ncbi:hypothetical protein [Acidihalobacter aeolianus]|nr:hypothetical protein [Acidihalobacter aeolianus]
MATRDLKTVPTDVPLTPDNIDRLAARAAELAAAFKRKIGKLQQQVADASGNINRDAQGIVQDADPADRAAAHRLAKNKANRSIAQFRRNIVASSHTDRQQILDQFAKTAADAEFQLCSHG